MAKEEIYTIPVIDAFNEDCECPLCHLYEKLEKDSVDFVLGPSYMEVDVRGYTNEFGFCRNHFTQLYAQSNRLGVALMLESHMKKIKVDMQKHLKQKKIGRLTRKKDPNSGLANYTNQLVESCYICNRVNGFFDRYLDTFFYLWKRDPDFQLKIKNSKGLCLKHFGELYDKSEKCLNKVGFDEFGPILIQLQEENLDRLIGDIEWFITKFDYRFEDEPWKNSKDSIIRSIQKIASFKPE